MILQEEAVRALTKAHIPLLVLVGVISLLLHMSTPSAKVQARYRCRERSKGTVQLGSQESLETALYFI
jgi:hypothetical protein